MNKILLSLMLVVGVVNTADANEYSGGNYENFLGHYYGNGGGNEQTTQPKKVIHIPSHYGAIAIDFKKSVGGVSEDNMKSLSAAKKEAIEQCVSNGGTECKIIASVKNACFGYGIGTEKSGMMFFVTKAEDYLNEVKQEILTDCKNRGGVKCDIMYTKCNRDPRYVVGK